MKKELICFIETNEQDELIRVSRVDDGTGQFMLLSLGSNRMVINVAELVEALGAIGHYSTLFDQEQKMRENRNNVKPGIAISITETTSAVQVASKVKKAIKNKEDDGALILEAQTRTGPTASELALEKQMKLMQGESLVFKKDE